MQSRLAPLAVSMLVLGLLVAGCGGAAPTATSPSAAESCTPVDLTGPDGQPIDLSGAWSGNDGGVYYMKQIDNCLWWSGLSNFEGEPPGDAWVMAFKGQIGPDKVIHGDFVDVKSSNPGSGTMTIQIDAQATDNGVAVYLHRTEATGHEIGVTFWQRVTTEGTPGPSGSPANTQETPTFTPAPSTSPAPSSTASVIPTTSGSGPPVTLPPG